MNPSADPVLTRWAADCAEHLLAQFPDFADRSASAAIAAARAWANGTGSVDDCREAAFAAHMSARELSEAGYRAAATCVRTAANAAASCDDATLAETAADYAIEALGLNSAPCELTSSVQAERRWQWTQLPEPQRSTLFADEPPEPSAPSCAI
jgi:hypothetical protein